MRVLLTSHRFHPNLGGIESMGRMLAEGFAARGHEVVVATGSTANAPDDFAYRLLRRPNAGALLAAFRWCDVLLQNNVGLRTAWPLLLVRRPWVVAHHTWIARVDGELAWRDRLKLRILRRSTGISISRAIAAQIDQPTTLIGNTYQETVFTENPEAVRDRDIVFLGRLVSDKGPQLPLQALKRLCERGLSPSLTYIGVGPEQAALESMTRTLGLNDQVRFVGALSGAPLAAELNRHKLMVVPSIWKEPFGIVALEGAACGCVVVGSAGGGLADAIGPCGPVFANGDVEALSLELFKLLESPAYRQTFRVGAAAHLREHGSQRVVSRYLEVLERAVAGQRSKPVPMNS